MTTVLSRNLRPYERCRCVSAAQVVQGGSKFGWNRECSMSAVFGFVACDCPEASVSLGSLGPIPSFLDEVEEITA